MKKCPTCKITQPKNEFNKHKGTKDGLYPKCKSCRKKEREQPENKKKHSERNKKWYLNNFKKIKKSLRKNSLKTLYNITIEDYNKMLKKQNGKCAICKTVSNENRNFSVDHDHKTNKIRGLLCIKCNTKLGIKEDKEFNKKADEYLKKYNKVS